MFSFFSKKKLPGKPSGSLELLSLHIPKTAGTSFRNTLAEVYGPNNIARFDIHVFRGRFFLNEEEVFIDKLPDAFRVLHGHFPMNEMYRHFPDAQKLPVITWLRNPVSRVVSNYFYLLQQMNKDLEAGGKKARRWHRVQRTLEEFAADPANQNQITRFVTGKNIDDFLFVGIVETYQEDLKRLSNLLNWDNPPIFHFNETEKKQNIIEPALLQKIEKWNEADMKLYQYVLDKKSKSR